MSRIFSGRKRAVSDWLLLHRPGTVVGGRTSHSPPAFDPGGEFPDKSRAVHGDAFRLSNPRQECRRSQRDGRCGNPGRRSPAGALALGYDVAALQAGGAGWHGNALLWSAGASEARHRFSARGQAAARPRRTSRRVRRLAALVVVRKQSGVALRLPPHSKIVFDRSRSLHGRVVKGSRGVWHEGGPDLRRSSAPLFKTTRAEALL